MILCKFRKRERGLGGEGGGAISPLPRKKETATTTTATTQDNINNNNNKDQKNYQNSPLQLRRKIFLRSPASSCPKRKEPWKTKDKILVTWIYKMVTGNFQPSYRIMVRYFSPYRLSSCHRGHHSWLRKYALRVFTWDQKPQTHEFLNLKTDSCRLAKNTVRNVHVLCSCK